MNSIWIVSFYNNDVEQLAVSLPGKLRARFLQLLERIESRGILNEPHSKAMSDGLFEIRAKSEEGIARGLYCYLSGKQVIVLHIFMKKTGKIPKSDLNIARQRLNKIREGGNDGID